MPKKRDRFRGRRFHHIDKGGSAFLPLSRMREIRWDEAVIRSVLRREGRHDAIYFRHVHFHCGTGCCLGTAIPLLSDEK